MTTPYAMSCELIKYAYRQNKDGVVISFVVHPNDIPAALQVSHIGSRWMAALVQIGDDETPIQPPAKEIAAKPRPALPQEKAGAKRDWRDLSPAQQAGIRCEEAAFAAFLKEERPDDWHESADDAAACVRLICGVTSRAYIEKDQRSRVIWKQLDDQFQAWKAVEHA